MYCHPRHPSGRRMQSRCERSQGRKKECYIYLDLSSEVKMVSNEQEPEKLPISVLTWIFLDF